MTIDVSAPLLCWRDFCESRRSRDSAKLRSFRERRHFSTAWKIALESGRHKAKPKTSQPPVITLLCGRLVTTKGVGVF